MIKLRVARELIPVEAVQRLKTVEGLTFGHTVAPEGRKATAVSDDRIDAVKAFVTRQVWAMIQLQRLTATGLAVRFAQAA